MIKCLFASSEAYPLAKTGGLADVSASLPVALAALKQGKRRAVDIRLVMPAYPEAIVAAGKLTRIASIKNTGAVGAVEVLEGVLPGSNIRVWLIDAAEYFQREGGPYSDIHGNDWPDNAARFTVFSRAVCALAMDAVGLNWRADVVHANDWQTGLVPALLSPVTDRPATIFTIHNLAYQGVYSAETFFNLSLPPSLWTLHGLEYHGGMSLIKGGLSYADALTTVSPTYAREIQTAAFGFGLDGLLRHRADDLYGILNGIDMKSWDPACDPHLEHGYDSTSLAGKQANKALLQKQLGFKPNARTPVLGFIGRLVWQKGVDILAETLPTLLKLPLQFVILGNGAPAQEATLQQLAREYPNKLAVIIGYSEKLAHQIEAGCDMFTMLSRYEPCGLNQLYSLRYGTVPIVSKTGGLADTVIDASDIQKATGFTFEPASARHFINAVQRALSCYKDKERWQGLVQRGMQKDFSWTVSASQYLDLYRKVLRQV